MLFLSSFFCNFGNRIVYANYDLLGIRINPVRSTDELLEGFFNLCSEKIFKI